MTATHAAVKQLTKKVQEHGHMLYLDNSFVTQLIQRPDKTENQLLWIVRPQGEGMLQNLLPQNDWNEVTFILGQETT
jgi:hypothetical protein